MEDSGINQRRVATERQGKVLVITVDNAPVNALSSAVRQELLQAIEAAEADAGCEAVVLHGAGKHFSGGADVREFGKAGLLPTLPDLCARIEALSKPVIAAIHGVCLGGGFELALSAHYRVAAEDARIGLPEVLLGLLPGAGGTQRTTRLGGARIALDLALSGRQAGARELSQHGLIDMVVASKNIVGAPVAFAVELARQGIRPRRAREATSGLADIQANRGAVEQARADAEKKFRGLLSPFQIIEAVEVALEKPFDEGMAVERGYF